MERIVLRYLLPDFYAESAISISPMWLQSLGVRVVFIDLDNTLTPTGFWDVGGDERRWIEQLRLCGMKVYIVSNEARSRRVAHIANTLNVRYIAPAWKPRTSLIRRILEADFTEPHSAAMIGDQLFTDVLMAKRLGMLTILVKPMTNLSFITTKVMRCFERPLLKWMRQINLLRHCP
ncbi:MAG: YqeG family HAD IIIA-type phosphatase [Armatimonadetes bacterium]|nr:YqeG family HAD IIIA-type phosphatase [Armatimonadota bacterium]